MNERAASFDEPWRVGCIVALAIFMAPLVVVAAWPDGLVLSEEWFFLLLLGLMLALPFGYLALDGTRDWLPWSVATLLSVICWGFLFRFGGPGPGAALISVAIPLIVTAAAWVSNRNES